MILGVGTDLIDARRVEKLIEKEGQGFSKKFFAPSEQLMADQRTHPDRRALFFASRFAAKEACAKALGTGIQGGVNFQDIVIHKDDLGKPWIELQGGAKERLEQMIGQSKKPQLMPRIDLSLSDEYPFCIAFVIISME